jgi:hypothetical protein
VLLVPFCGQWVEALVQRAVVVQVEAATLLCRSSGTLRVNEEIKWAGWKIYEAYILRGMVHPSGRAPSDEARNKKTTLLGGEGSALALLSCRDYRVTLYGDYRPTFRRHQSEDPIPTHALLSPHEGLLTSRDSFTTYYCIPLGLSHCCV